MKRGFRRSGFTLVELMIGVAIIGMLVALALPKILRSGRNTRARRFASEVRVAAGAFVQYSLENSDYPDDKTPGVIPDGMAPYLRKFDWAEETAIGGRWDWDHKVFGVIAGVSVKDPKFDSEQMTKIDALIDDGNLASGEFRTRSGGYMYVIEE